MTHHTRNHHFLDRAERALAWLVCSFAVLLSAGCSSASDDDTGEAAPTRATYALTTTVFDDTSAATYVALVDSLDNRQVSLTAAAEFAGWSSVATLDGALFVGHGDRPEINRYPVNESGELADPDPRTLNLAQYGLGSASFSFNTFVDSTMAHTALEETSRILWDPEQLELVGMVKTPEVATERDGLGVTAANFQGRVVQGDRVFQPFFWHDVDWYEFHQDSQIGIYSRNGDLEELVDVPCPALQIATQDEEGNLYFSGMVDTIGYQLVEKQGSVERCVVRINAGQSEIAEGWPRRFEELTDGRPAGVFYYLKDGIGVLSVYHDENVDPESENFLDEWYTDNWGLWLVDLEAWEAHPLDEFGLGASNIFFSRVDERLFIHRVEAGFAKTTISEITSTGSITDRITIPGYAAYPVLRIR